MPRLAGAARESILGAQPRSLLSDNGKRTSGSTSVLVGGLTGASILSVYPGSTHVRAVSDVGRQASADVGFRTSTRPARGSSPQVMGEDLHRRGAQRTGNVDGRPSGTGLR